MAKQNTSFVQTETWTSAPQVLQVVEGEAVYDVFILHATLEQVRRRAPRRTKGHVHDIYHVVLYTQGEGHFWLNNRFRPFKKGTLVLSGPGDIHDYCAVDCEAAYTEVSFGFRRRDTGEALPLPFPQLLERITGTPIKNFGFTSGLDEEGASRAARLIADIVGHLQDRSGFGPFHTCVRLARLLALCADLCLSPASADATPSLSPLGAARDFIQSNYTGLLTVDSLARIAGMSRGHFLRQFKACYGTSPIAYQIHLRMGAAKVLLKTTDLRCHEIAARVGFDDVFHFSKSFKSACSVAPTVFRATTYRT